MQRDRSPNIKLVVANINLPQVERYDAIVLGGGAAGLMCALTAAGRGKKILLLELSNKLGKKILMSGGGRCNFTNLEISADNFICNNSHFVKSALSQYTQWDFIAWVAASGIAYHEKSLGQLFCDNSAKDVLKMLFDACNESGVEIRLNCEVTEVTHDGDFTISTTSKGSTSLRTDISQALVVACGGLSIPTLGGASGYGYRLAQDFGLRVNPTAAALVPFTLSGKWHELSQSLSGVSLPVIASVPNQEFAENMLFTHRGLSGPAMLQLSNYWSLGEEIEIDLLPSEDLAVILNSSKRHDPSRTVSAVLSEYLPKSLVQELYGLWWCRGVEDERRLNEYKDSELVELAKLLKCWRLVPSGTEGYRTAEVTSGGVDVEAVSSKTMEVKHIQGLYFIGEVLDVTGQLGGFNFQWAWSSGYVAGVHL